VYERGNRVVHQIRGPVVELSGDLESAGDEVESYGEPEKGAQGTIPRDRAPVEDMKSRRLVRTG
jgi:hypothetical protein